MEGCPLCPPYRGEGQQVVLENAHCLYLRQDQRVLQGSGLIVPRAHRETVFDLTPAEWEATRDLLAQVRRLLDQEFKPGGYNVGWNCYPVAGQSIMHAHLHVIPRFPDEPFAGKGIRHWLKSEANRRPGLRITPSEPGGWKNP